MMTRYVVGCMTGTSMDGMDAALVAIEGKGLEIKPKFLKGLSWGLGPLSNHLRKAGEQQPLTAGQFAVLSYRVGLRHAALIRRLVKDHQVDFACVHGQTIYHQPPVTWQLLNPAPIAHRLSIPVLFDMRLADMAMGGQGAPISPISDHFMYRSPEETRVVLNLGGFVNYSWLPSRLHDEPQNIESIRGGDICACNQLLDAISRVHFKEPFDQYGQRAMGGDVASEVFQYFTQLLSDQAEDRRSLGTGDELMEIADVFSGQYRPEDIARSACAAIARVVSRSLGECDRVIVAGGGVKNSALIRELRQHLGERISSSDDFGFPAQFREAILMAVLGVLTQDGIPIYLPQITGSATPTPLAGVWMFPLGWHPLARVQYKDQ